MCEEHAEISGKGKGWFRAGLDKGPLRKRQEEEELTAYTAAEGKNPTYQDRKQLKMSNSTNPHSEPMIQPQNSIQKMPSSLK